jgi:hypothetical protein
MNCAIYASWDIAPYFIAVMMEAVRNSDMSVYFNETTQRFAPEGYHPRTRRRENLTSHNTS